MLAQRLHKAIQEVCPIEGVSIGRKNDKSTWRIDFSHEATKEQRLNAENVVLAFDPKSPDADTKRAEIAELEKQEMMPRSIREIMLALMEATFTPAQLSGDNGYQKVKAFDEQVRALRASL